MQEEGAMRVGIGAFKQSYTRRLRLYVNVVCEAVRMREEAVQSQCQVGPQDEVHGVRRHYPDDESKK